MEPEHVPDWKTICPLQPTGFQVPCGPLSGVKTGIDMGPKGAFSDGRLDWVRARPRDRGVERHVSCTGHVRGGNTPPAKSPCHVQSMLGAWLCKQSMLANWVQACVSTIVCERVLLT